MDEEDLNQSRGKEEQHLTHKVEIVVAVVLGSMLFAFACAIMAPHFGMKPNELGDFFAGVFAPLAFAGIAVGLYLQHRSLNAQYEELKLQRLEFTKMVGETAKMSKESARANELQEKESQASEYRKWVSSDPELKLDGKLFCINNGIRVRCLKDARFSNLGASSDFLKIIFDYNGGGLLSFKESPFDTDLTSEPSSGSYKFCLVTTEGSRHEYELKATQLAGFSEKISCELTKLPLSS